MRTGVSWSARRKIWKASGRTCWLCGQHVSWRTCSWDHTRPRSKGGRDHRHNLRPAHLMCNWSRGDRIGLRYLLPVLLADIRVALDRAYRLHRIG